MIHSSIESPNGAINFLLNYIQKVDRHLMMKNQSVIVGNEKEIDVRNRFYDCTRKLIRINFFSSFHSLAENLCT